VQEQVQEQVQEGGWDQEQVQVQDILIILIRLVK